MAENVSEKKQPPVEKTGGREAQAGDVLDVTLNPMVLEALVARSLNPKISKSFWPRLTDARCDHRNGFPEVHFMVKLVPSNVTQKKAMEKKETLVEKLKGEQGATGGDSPTPA